MQMNGKITAKSEIIRLKSGRAFLFALYNKYNDATYFVFVQGPRLSCWREKIAVNQCYMILNLKKCSLITKVYQNADMYRVRSGTELQEIQEKDLCLMKFSPQDESATFTKSICQKGSESGPLMISYEGCITKVKDAYFGAYELDDKILLYTTFLKLNTTTPDLFEGSTVLIHNAHFLEELKIAKTLVCCGLSSVEITEPGQQKVDSATEENFCVKFVHNFGLNFSDLKWLEDCLEMLSKMFYKSIIINTPNPFSGNSELIGNIISNLIRCRNDGITQNQGSSPHCLIKEFTSDPHSCVITSQSNLGKEFTLQSISDILRGPKEDALWSYHSNSWKCSSVCTKDVVLAGVLCSTKDGRICIMDSSCKVQVMFSDHSEASFSISIGKLLKVLASSNIFVVIKDFQVICEEFVNDSKQADFFVWVKISCIFPLFELADTAEIHYVLDMLPIHYPNVQNIKQVCSSGKNVQPLFNAYKTTNNTFVQNQTCDDDNLCSLFKRSISFKTTEIAMTCKENSQLDVRYISQKILICGKTVPILRNGAFYQEVLVLLLGSKSILKIPHHSDTKSHSSLWTTELHALEFMCPNESVLSETSIEFKPAILSFTGSVVKSCALLFPNFFYRMLISTDLEDNTDIDNCCSDTSYHHCPSTFATWDKAIVFEMNLSSQFIFQRDSQEKLHRCLKESLAILPKKYSVEDVLHKRSLNKFAFLRGIITEKWIDTNLIESQLNASKESSGQKKTLSFILKDCQTSNCIRAYVSHFLLPIHGLIPGAIVEIFGFSCHCSKKGNLYLKSNGPFGLHLVDINEDLVKEICQSDVKGKYMKREVQIPWNFLSRVVADNKFKSICFVLKILKVELFVVCTLCSENTPKSCTCKSEPFVKSKAVFLVDDGSSQNFVHCADGNVKALLSLDHSEWHALTSYVKETSQSLIYDHKTQESANGGASTDSLFYLMCSSSLIKRKIVVECRPYSNSDYAPASNDPTYHRRNSKSLRLFAFAVYEPKTRDITLEHLNHLKKRLK